MPNKKPKLLKALIVRDLLHYFFHSFRTIPFTYEDRETQVISNFDNEYNLQRVYTQVLYWNINFSTALRNNSELGLFTYFTKCGSIYNNFTIFFDTFSVDNSQIFSEIVALLLNLHIQQAFLIDLQNLNFPPKSLDNWALKRIVAQRKMEGQPEYLESQVDQI